MTIYPNPGTMPFWSCFQRALLYLVTYVISLPDLFCFWEIWTLIWYDSKENIFCLFVCLFLFHSCYKVSLQVIEFHKENPSSCLVVLLFVLAPVEALGRFLMPSRDTTDLAPAPYSGRRMTAERPWLGPGIPSVASPASPPRFPVGPFISEQIKLYFKAWQF